MKKIIFLTFTLLTAFFSSLAQYSANFSVIEKGVKAPSTAAEACVGTAVNSDPSLCPTYDVSGMNWTLTGTLADPFNIAYSISTVDRSYAKTIAGNIFQTMRPLGDVCMTSPVLDISNIGAVDISINVFRSSVGSTYASPDDDVEFKYSVNGGPVVTTGSLTGMGGTTSSWNPTGITGNTLQVYACLAANGFSEQYDLRHFSVSGGITLPIKLSGFFIKQTPDNQVEVLWQTAMEQNNEYFEIERSYDGKTFETIGTVKSKGNTTSGFNYSFTDAEPNESINYYRLKQNDYDGSFEHSNVLSVKISSKEDRFEVSPNPADNILNMSYLGKKTPEAMIEIYNLQGQMIYRENNISNQKNIDISNFKSGLYILKINNNGKIQSEQFFKI